MMPPLAYATYIFEYFSRLNSTHICCLALGEIPTNIPQYIVWICLEGFREDEKYREKPERGQTISFALLKKCQVQKEHFRKELIVDIWWSNNRQRSFPIELTNEG